MEEVHQIVSKSQNNITYPPGKIDYLCINKTNEHMELLKAKKLCIELMEKYHTT